MNRVLAAVSYFLFLLPLRVEGTAFSYNDDMQCGSPVNIDITSLTCDGSDVCHFGSKMEVEGTLGLSEGLESSSMCATTKACFMGWSWACRTYIAEIDVCDSLNLSSMDGSACPAASSYYLSSALTLPGQDEMQLGSGWSVTAYITLTDDCDSDYTRFSLECQASFSAVSTAESTTTAGAALFGVGALAFLVARKRRKATIDLAKEEEKADLDGHFEMMSEQGVRV